MPTSYWNDRRGGHCPGHVRETFLAALGAYLDWDPGESEPTVELEVDDQPMQIPLRKAAGLVWNCNDILRSDTMQDVQCSDLNELVKRRTYASAARALAQRISERSAAELTDVSDAGR